MYLIYGTPKAIWRLRKELHKIPKEYSPYKLFPTPYVYMNMMGGWTEDECDNVVYLIKEENLCQNLIFQR